MKHSLILNVAVGACLLFWIYDLVEIVLYK